LVLVVGAVRIVNKLPALVQTLIRAPEIRAPTITNTIRVTGVIQAFFVSGNVKSDGYDG